MSAIDVLLDSVEWEALPENREAGELPYPTHRGILKLGNVELECYVLNTGLRVFSAESIDRFFGSMA